MSKQKRPALFTYRLPEIFWVRTVLAKDRAMCSLPNRTCASIGNLPKRLHAGETKMVSGRNLA